MNAINYFILIVILTADLANAQENIFVLDIDLHANGSAQVKSLSMEEGVTTYFPSTWGEYSIEIRDSSNAIYFKKSFDAKFEVTPYAMPTVKQDKVNFYWRLPYDGEAEKIVISKKNIPLATIRIQEALCIGDKQCPQYCKARSFDPDCENRPNDNDILPIAGMILIGIGAAIFIIQRVKKHSQEPTPPYSSQPDELGGQQ